MIYQVVYKLCSYKTRAKLLRKKGVNIGNNSEIYPDVIFGSEPYLISIGNNVRITSGVKLITHDGGLWVLRNNGKLKNSDKFGKIRIGSNVHIGINSIIMPGVDIGDNCIIGCGAVVTKNVPSNSVAVGVPARVIESIDEYYNKVNKDCVYTKHMNYSEKKEYILNNVFDKKQD